MEGYTPKMLAALEHLVEQCGYNDELVVDWLDTVQENFGEDQEEDYLAYREGK